MTVVHLRGGPLAGEHRDVDEVRRLLTIDWENEYEERDEDGCTLYVTRIQLATYRRVDETTFEWCRTPTAPGDTDLELPADGSSNAAPDSVESISAYLPEPSPPA